VAGVNAWEPRNPGGWVGEAGVYVVSVRPAGDGRMLLWFYHRGAAVIIHVVDVEQGLVGNIAPGTHVPAVGPVRRILEDPVLLSPGGKTLFAE